MTIFVFTITAQEQEAYNWKHLNTHTGKILPPAGDSFSYGLQRVISECTYNEMNENCPMK